MPSVTLLLAIPLALEKVPPNPIYGFRSQKTYSSRKTWYAANKLCGLTLLASLLAVLMINGILLYFSDGTIGHRPFVMTYVAGTGIALVVSLLLIRKID